LGINDIGDIEQLVVPGIERNDFARIAGEHIRDDAALDRRDDFLALWREGR
jgi:hypothetical protein